MRLTTEELSTLTKYLVSSLSKSRFSVKTNRYGNILYIEKFGINCCPAILNSTEDGKHGYAYIQLVTNSYSEKDLGSYYKPRTNKSKHQLFTTNNSIDKYAGNDVHIDMNNYKQVISTFISDLNKDYRRIISKREDLEIDAVDPGTCVYEINPNTNIGWWHISADNYALKYALIDCIKGLFDVYNTGELDNGLYGLHKQYIEEVFTTYSITECTWSVSEPHYGYIILSFIRPEGGTAYDKISISNNKGAGDVLDVIENWVKNHPDRMFKSGSLIESLVKIKDTGTVFDGMTGVVENDGGDKLTVLVDFNAEHKVRNTFKKEQLEVVEE